MNVKFYISFRWNKEGVLLCVTNDKCFVLHEKSVLVPEDDAAKNLEVVSYWNRAWWNITTLEEEQFEYIGEL